MTQHSAFLYACLLLTISLRDDFTVSAAEEKLQSLAGQSCTTTDDCFGGKACLGSEGNKRCCDFYERDFNSDDGLYKGCNACGDEIAQDYLGRSKPGLCETCASGYTYLDGQAHPTISFQPGSDDFVGRCVPDDMCDFSTEYMYAMSASTYYCSNLQAAGDDSWSGDGGWSCLSGVSLGDYCCAEGATVPSNGDCCTHCAQGTGTCAARSTCSPCDASGAIENGIASPCTSSLAAGASCEPTCNGGYTLTGSRSCDGQNLADTAACNAISCDPDYYVEDNDGACTPCPAHSTSDRAGSSYCVCDGGYRAVKLAGAWLCAACEGAVGSRIPQENGEDAVCASAVRFAAEESREALLDDIADERQKNKAKLLADAAIAGEKVKKITVKEDASDEDSACSSAFTKAGMRSTDGACIATAEPSGRRHLSATTYDVELLFMSSTVSDAALISAANSLTANGARGVRFESAVDPIAELETVPGIDSTKLATFETAANAAVEAMGPPAEPSATQPQPSAATAPPPPPPTTRELVYDDDNRAARVAGVIVGMATTVCNMLLTL